jgi:general secretion pathway protein K
MKKRSRGAALLVAMLTVTLVATIAAGAMWQQWRSVEIEAADRTRVQSSWILTGALDWARLILREDMRSGNTDHLAVPWAVPLQEARLSTFLAADPNNTTEASDADNVFLSGEINDLQAKLNLGALATAGTIVKEPEISFGRLFDVLGLPQDQLATLKENLRFASDLSTENRNGSRAALLPQRLEQLAWLGVSPDTIAALEPYVTILPKTTIATVNINPAPAEVIYAVAREGLTLADAKRLVEQRQRQHFQSVNDAVALVSGAKFSAQAAVASRYFEVRGRLRLNDVVIEERSIVLRDANLHVLQRERGAFQAFAPDATRR